MTRDCLRNIPVHGARLGLAAAAAISLASTRIAQAATEIVVEYRYRTVRIKPSYLEGGSPEKFVFILRDDGKVEEQRELSGEKGKKSSRTTTLGPRGTGAIIRVVDESTIQRIAQTRTHTQTLTVKVKDRTCTASIDIRLKPGFTEYEGYSTQLGIMAIYRTMETRDVTCSIK